MNDIQIFKNEQFGQIRMVEIDDKPYFVATDIAKTLGYKDTTNAIKQHCRWVVKHKVPHPQSKNKTLEVNVIPEGDMYRLITNSELPSAEKFESWVFDEVLPSIRKHGMYATDELINNPDLLIAAATKIKEERQARLEAEKLRDKLIRGFIGSGQNRNMICINESGLYSLILGRLLMTTVKNQLWNGVTIRYVVNMMLNPYLPELPKRYFRK